MLRLAGKDESGVSIYLDELSADLKPWLLALSAAAAEFAETVADDGTRKAADS